MNKVAEEMGAHLDRECDNLYTYCFLSRAVSLDIEATDIGAPSNRSCDSYSPGH
jgi:hypothetical protein